MGRGRGEEKGARSQPRLHQALLHEVAAARGAARVARGDAAARHDVPQAVLSCLSLAGTRLTWLGLGLGLGLRARASGFGLGLGLVLGFGLGLGLCTRARATANNWVDPTLGHAWRQTHLR